MKVCTDSCLFGAWCAAEISFFNNCGKKLLDIGTGTGLLTLMVAQKNDLYFDAVEIEEEAGSMAYQNFQASPWKEKLTVQVQDIANWKTDKKYDYIICNPPFYENELPSPNTNKNVAHHSQELSLPDVVACINQLLSDDGLFFLLLPFKRKKEIENRLLKEGFFLYKSITVSPSNSHHPFRLLLQGGRKKPATTEDFEMAICTEGRNYSPQFKSLLKDYYLHL